MKLVRTIGITALCIGILGCATFPGGQQANLLSTRDEVEIGRKVSAEIEKKEKLLDNPEVQNYVRQIGERVARVSPRQDLEYSFKVIDAPDTVNAFALPGGFMYIYTGLLELCANEGELAGVMAHELGHVAAHHHGQALTRQFKYQTLVDFVLGKNPSPLGQTLASLFGTGMEIRFSREQESEADQLGMDILFRAGYKPEAMLSFMMKMMEEEKQRGGARPRLLAFLSSHPPTLNRIGNLQTLLANYPKNMRDKSPTYPERYKTNCLDHLPAAS